MAEGVVASALSTHESGTVARDVIDSGEPRCGIDSEAAAAAVAARPSAAFYPSSCVEKTADGSAVHVELHACSGRFGRSRLTGGLDATLDSTPDCRLHADVTDSGDLVANGHPLDYRASADIEPHSGYENVAWQAEWSGTTPRGRSIHQVSDLDLVTQDGGCVGASGTAHGEVDGIDYRISIADLAVCPDACPTTGTVHAEVDGRLRQRNLSVRFDGTTQAHVTGYTGREFDVTMDCAPAR